MSQNSKQIKYVGRDFPELKQELMNFVKQYYPTYFNNISDYTVEMMFIELMSVVGDINNFYIDDRFRELFIQHAEEPESIFRNAKELGYKPKTVSVASGTVLFSQLIPATLSGSVIVPDTDSCVTIYPNSLFSDSSNNLIYTSTQIINVANYDDLDSEVQEISGQDYVRVYKQVPVRSGVTKLKNISFDNTVVPYNTILLDSNVSFVESVVDSEGNKWYEVDFLAQDVVFEDLYDEEKGSYILRPRTVGNRYVTDHNSRGECYLKFGSGQNTDASNREVNIFDEIASSNVNTAFIIEQFLRSDSYGNIPYNTTLTVRYVTSNGDSENIKANNVNNITKPNYGQSIEGLPVEILNSFRVTNTESITGGEFLNDVEKIRREASDNYLSQNRCVTVRDYILRAKVLPTKYGQIDKVFVEKDTSGKLNMYVLSRTNDNKLALCNQTTKENLKKYISSYKMIGDSIAIKDAYIINIGVKFDYLVRNNFIKDEVFFNICRKIEDFFNINNWDINQPIVVQDLINAMYEAEGVLNISNLDFVNKYDTDEGYSGIRYDVSITGDNCVNDILYPPMDVGIFELKKPLDDIEGN